jgi:hypothetical protein
MLQVFLKFFVDKTQSETNKAINFFTKQTPINYLGLKESRIFNALD